MTCLSCSRVSIALLTILLFSSIPQPLSAATVSGTVSDSIAGTPISDGWVDIVIDAPCSDPEWYDYVELDSNGNFTFTDLPAGTYYLRTDVSDYVTEWWATTESSPLCGNAEAFTVTSEEVVSGKNFQIGFGSTISGTLYDESNNALAGGYVEIYSDSPCSNPEYIDYAEVDSEGKYIFTAIIPGTYYLRSDAEGNFLNEWWASPASSVDCLASGQIVVGTDETIINQNFQLGPGATISGTVSDEGGNAVSGKYVRAYTGDPCGENVFFTGARIAEDGTYTLVGLPDTTYYLRTNLEGMHQDEWWDDPTSSINCLDAAPIAVTSQETVVGKNFQVNFITISGTVYDNAGNAITDGSVNVYTGQPCGTTVNVDTASLDSSGHYSTQHLPPGNYYLKAVPDADYYDEWWQTSASSRECGDAQAIIISDTSVNDKDFQLDPMLTIFGTVSDDTGTPVTAGKIDIYTGDPCGDKSRVAIASLDGNGDYRSAPLNSGNYFLLTVTDDTDYVDEWWADPASSIDCSAAHAVALGPELMTTATSFQIDRTATIAGTVTDQTGVAITSGNVGAYTGEPCGTNERIASGTIDSSGNYTIDGIPPGEYFLLTDPPTEYIEEWWAPISSTEDCSGAQLITVVAGDELNGKHFQLGTGSTISGTVYDNEGAPLTGGYVLAYNVAPCEQNSLLGQSAVADVVLDANGAYSLPKLKSGDYYLKTMILTGYIDEWWTNPEGSVNCSDAEAITVNSNETVTGKNFKLGMGATVSGAILDIADNPLYALLKVFTGDPCGDYEFVAFALSLDGTGNYTSQGLLPGDYYLQAVPFMSLHTSEWWDNSESSLDCHDAKQITISDLETVTNKNFNLDPGGQISGTVYDQTGTAPVTEGYVRFYHDSEVPCGTPVHFSQTPLNSSDGNYSAVLPAGGYYIHAYSNAGHSSEWWATGASNQDCSEAEVIIVTTGESIQNRDLQLDGSSGDINSDNTINLIDVILGLQIISGSTSSASISISADINNDNKIGVEEVIYDLKALSN